MTEPKSTNAGGVRPSDIKRVFFFAKHQDLANYISNEFQCFTLVINQSACSSIVETVLSIDENPIKIEETATSLGSALIFRKIFIMRAFLNLKEQN